MTTPPDPSEPPSTVPAAGSPPAVPDHELLRPIGSGSSGQVWLARNALGTYRAVKIVPERQSRQGSVANEFNGILKFEPVSRLHDGLVDILQVGRNEAAGYFYYVMELADDVACGQNIVPETYLPRTLAQDRARLKRLPVAECVRLGAAIASALGFLHQHGLIHRDIKPHNIIFVNGAPKLADIGLVTEASGVQSQTGTQGFIPPEGSGTIRADIYSLGKVLYEISTGKDRNDYPVLPELPGNAAEDEALLLGTVPDGRGNDAGAAQLPVQPRPSPPKKKRAIPDPGGPDRLAHHCRRHHLRHALAAHLAPESPPVTGRMVHACH